MWETKTGEKRTGKPGHPYNVTCVAAGPDGTSIASGGGDDPIVRLWDLSDGRPRELAGHNKEVISLAFSPVGNMLASGSFDRTRRL